jgi:hypothetical protein
MGKIRPGNKQNAALNGERGAHVRGDDKKITSGLRRAKIKKENHKDLKEEEEKRDNWYDEFNIGYCDCQNCIDNL